MHLPERKSTWLAVIRHVTSQCSRPSAAVPTARVGIWLTQHHLHLLNLCFLPRCSLEVCFLAVTMTPRLVKNKREHLSGYFWRGGSLLYWGKEKHVTGPTHALLFLSVIPHDIRGRSGHFAPCRSKHKDQNRNSHPESLLRSLSCYPYLHFSLSN